MKKVLLVLVAVSLVGFPGSFAAAFSPSNCPICTRAPSDNHLTKSAATLVRGVANVCFGWMDLIRQPSREIQAGGEGLMIGVAKGIGHTLMRTLRGIGDIVLSPLPKAKDGSQLAKNCPLCMMESE